MINLSSDVENLSPFEVFVSLVENIDDEEEIASVRRMLEEQGDLDMLHLFDLGHKQYVEDSYQRMCQYLWPHAS